MSSINEKKYKNLILFFANRIKNGTLGKLKMMKLLYFLDFDFFEKYGKSVSGDDYLRFQNGPVPRMAEKILKKMAGSEIKINRRKIGVGWRDQQHIEALKDFYGCHSPSGHRKRHKKNEKISRSCGIIGRVDSFV